MRKGKMMSGLIMAFCPLLFAGDRDAELIALVEGRFSSAAALETVAFVESRWRAVGNHGFDESILHVRDLLLQAGFAAQAEAPMGARLTYRLERRPLAQPAWEPVDAAIWLGDETLMSFADNRNMIAIHSPGSGDILEGELVYVGTGPGGGFKDKDLRGRIAFGEGNLTMLYYQAVVQGQALGVIAYQMPAYTQPERHPDSVQFNRIPYRADNKGFALVASYRVKQRLAAALADNPTPPRLRVKVATRMYAAEELTLVADIAGSAQSAERFVFSAHVQEPGANDNASGVGVLAEIAVVAAGLVKEGTADPQRGLSFIWGNEIVSTQRYITEDPDRARGIKWGMSLDMVGENTSLTGGSFLIEKMPDPSAIWTRGTEHHTEWGARKLRLEEMKPHYFNDFVLNRFRAVARGTDWVVATNPFEGGSDHVPFLNANIPGLLLWHFTDVFYHTDADRLDKVSETTMERVGVGALVTALELVSADDATARRTIAELVTAAGERLAMETALSREAVAQGSQPQEQAKILEAWRDWYLAALRSCADLPLGDRDQAYQTRIDQACAEVETAARRSLEEVAASRKKE